MYVCLHESTAQVTKNKCDLHHKYWADVLEQVPGIHVIVKHNNMFHVSWVC